MSRYRSVRIVVIVVSIVILVIGFIPPTPDASAQQQTDVANEVLAQLNQWRIEQGTWPVKPNKTLAGVAMAQAQYLLTLPALPDDGAIHNSPQGYPKDRARAANWPTYGASVQIAEDEIAYVGYDVKAAINFWKGSAIHAKTSLNPYYREVGVAVLPHPLGHLFIVDFGGQPNVLPTLFDPSGNTLYLSNDTFPQAARYPQWISNATEVQLFDSEGRPVSDGWIPWQPTMQVPENVGSKMYIAYTDSNVQTVSEVQFDTDIAVLPDNVAGLAPAPTEVPSPTRTPTRPPTSVPPTALPGVTSTIPPVVSPTPLTAAVTNTPAPTSSVPDLLIVYDSKSLAIVNNSAQPQNLSNLVLTYGTSTLAVSRWKTQFLNVPLTAFPAHDCLQVWSWDETTDLKPPSSCRIQRSVINVGPNQLFWTTTSFTVNEGSTVLASCPVGPGTCSVFLNAGQ